MKKILSLMLLILSINYIAFGSESFPGCSFVPSPDLVPVQSPIIKSIISLATRSAEGRIVSCCMTRYKWLFVQCGDSEQRRVLYNALPEQSVWDECDPKGSAIILASQALLHPLDASDNLNIRIVKCATTLKEKSELELIRKLIKK